MAFFICLKRVVGTHILYFMFLIMAEKEGFEPSIRYKRIHTFQACAFDHSAISPTCYLSFGKRIKTAPIELTGAQNKLVYV